MCQRFDVTGNLENFYKILRNKQAQLYSSCMIDGLLQKLKFYILLLLERIYKCFFYLKSELAQASAIHWTHRQCLRVLVQCFLSLVIKKIVFSLSRANKMFSDFSLSLALKMFSLSLFLANFFFMLRESVCHPYLSIFVFIYIYLPIYTCHR